MAPRTNDHVEVGGYRIWVEVEGAGEVTVAFETGNGSDSGVWAEIAPRIRAAGARTFLYDRAGMGRSEAAPQPYSIDDEVEALRSALTSCGIDGPIVLAAHSYGGFISLLLASLDERVAGLVLVDANIPAFFTEAEVASILAEYRPQYEQLREQAPELAATLIPIMEAYPATAARLRSVAIPASLPIVDIVAEHSWAATPDERDGDARGAYGVRGREQRARVGLRGRKLAQRDARRAGSRRRRDRPDARARRR